MTELLPGHCKRGVDKKLARTVGGMQVQLCISSVVVGLRMLTVSLISLINSVLTSLPFYLFINIQTDTYYYKYLSFIQCH